ncbi:Rrf2 family transcriptional regulator [candidate division WOR-3 bacterium]|nr:Rrf2 family transcriptional regulator [candidate division WOR-3 bacterium]
MKFSSKTRYGLRAMIELALCYKDRPILLKEIAERLDVSMKYLDHIISSLKARGLIVRVKEGYILGRAPENINCGEIVDVLEGSLNPVVCIDSPSVCKKYSQCKAKNVWKKVGVTLRETLQSFTLEDLINGNV